MFAHFVTTEIIDMSLAQISHDSLPCKQTDSGQLRWELTRTRPTDVDPPITAEDRGRAAREMELELDSDYRTKVHPALPAWTHPSFSDLMERELARKASGLPMEGGVDTGRYEALEPPSTDPTSDERRPEVLEAWRDVLRRAYASSTHLHTRLANLALLEEFGKNAWLIGNAQLEEMLRGLERELAQVRERTDEVNKARKAAQMEAHAELEALTQSWQQGVGKVIEVEVAAERLRLEILQSRRDGSRRI